MAKISFVLPCEPKWSEGIYQLEVSDAVLGYDPALGIDGPANQQWKELGDRTLYLRDLLNSNHTDGKHSLKAKDFKRSAQIPESALDLSTGTMRLTEKILNLRLRGNTAQAIMDGRTDRDLSAAWILSRIIPFSREYFNSETDFNFLNGETTIHKFVSKKITCEIAGDDSLDVEDTEGLVPGDAYFLMDEDGENIEEAVLMSILTDTRIRFSTTLWKTRTKGILSTASALGDALAINVIKDFTWHSGVISTLKDAVSGKLFIHRDAGKWNGKIFWSLPDEDDWREACLFSSTTFLDGTVDDVYSLPGGVLKIKLECLADKDQPARLHYFAIKSDRSFVMPETVRLPEITSIKLRGKTLSASSTSFASIWNLPQGAFELRVFSKDRQAFEPVVFSVPGPANSITAELPSNILNYSLLASCRHLDIEGSSSRWSKSVAVI